MATYVNFTNDDVIIDSVKDSWGNDIEVTKEKSLTPSQQKKEKRRLEKQLKSLRKLKKDDDEEVYNILDQPYYLVEPVLSLLG